MHAPLSTERQKYYQLMALVCEDLTMAAIDTLVRGGHPATTTQLTSIRSGRRIDLAGLVDIVRVALPAFQVPAELQPVATPQPLFS
ncbi:MAG: hypothetical protein ACRYF0_07620 [Janthinobacterium lividum]